MRIKRPHFELSIFLLLCLAAPLNAKPPRCSQLLTLRKISSFPRLSEGWLLFHQDVSATEEASKAELFAMHGNSLEITRFGNARSLFALSPDRSQLITWDNQAERFEVLTPQGETFWALEDATRVETPSPVMPIGMKRRADGVRTCVEKNDLSPLRPFLPQTFPAPYSTAPRERVSAMPRAVYSRNGKLLAIVRYKGLVEIFSVAERKLLYEFAVSPGLVSALAFDKGSQRLAIVTGSSLAFDPNVTGESLSIWDLSTGTRMHYLNELKSTPNSGFDFTTVRWLPDRDPSQPENHVVLAGHYSDEVIVVGLARKSNEQSGVRKRLSVNPDPRMGDGPLTLDATRVVNLTFVEGQWGLQVTDTKSGKTLTDVTLQSSDSLSWIILQHFKYQDTPFVLLAVRALQSEKNESHRFEIVDPNTGESVVSIDALEDFPDVTKGNDGLNALLDLPVSVKAKERFANPRHPHEFMALTIADGTFLTVFRDGDLFVFDLGTPLENYLNGQQMPRP